MTGARRAERTIQQLIITLGLALTAVVLVSFALLMVLHEADNRRRALESDSRVAAAIIGANSAAAIAFGNADEAREILGSVQASPDVLQARLYLPNGQVFAAYQRATEEKGCHALTPEGRDWRLSWCGASLYRPVLLHGQAVATVALQVSVAAAYRALLRTVAFSAAVAALAFGLSIPLWRRLARRVATPLTELVEVAERVGRQQDFSTRSQAGGCHEVTVLARAFNGMLGQLEQRDERLNDELAQRRRAELRLNDLAYFDNVTGLHNRHYFRERIDAALERATRELGSCALIYIDLDGFKRVNDQLGHDRGDELLREVGRRLTEALRKSDGVCRLGGDEFAVIIDGDVGVARVESIAAKLVATLALPYELCGQDAGVSASIGACLFPVHARDRETMIRHADKAMYQAKQAGKNRYCLYHPVAINDQPV